MRIDSVCYTKHVGGTHVIVSGSDFKKNQYIYILESTLKLIKKFEIGPKSDPMMLTCQWSDRLDPLKILWRNKWQVGLIEFGGLTASANNPELPKISETISDPDQLGLLDCKTCWRAGFRNGPVTHALAIYAPPGL